MTGIERHEIQETSQPKSPLLTAHRLSNTSLDNVNLEEDVDPCTVAVSTGKETISQILATKSM